MLLMTIITKCLLHTANSSKVPFLSAIVASGTFPKDVVEIVVSG